MDSYCVSCAELNPNMDNCPARSFLASAASCSACSLPSRIRAITAEALPRDLGFLSFRKTFRPAVSIDVDALVHTGFVIINQ
ncbi:hypothetical protein [Sporomusa ovata]|uniref:hypothetical protein n=1 Tax=Sporomusa ovata TaxID=2378 RepID=UPI003D157904